MTAPRPLRFRWNGSTMTPLQPGAAVRQYEKGEAYTLEVREERSGNSHRHYMAAVHEAWNQLPEHLADEFPSADHLRRWALIRTGWRDERTVVLASKAEAQRVAAFIKPIDPFAVVVPRETTVVVLTAKSQSYRSMGKAEFGRSKEAVLDLLADMIGTNKEALAKNAGRAA